jgi:hypothetical protein
LDQSKKKHGWNAPSMLNLLKQRVMQMPHITTSLRRELRRTFCVLSFLLFEQRICGVDALGMTELAALN